MHASANRLRIYYFAVFAAVGVFMPFQPIWLAARGVEGWRMGLIVALRPIAMVTAPLVFGFVADRCGLRGVLLRWASGGALLAIALLAIAYHFGDLGFAALLFGFLAFSLLRVPMVTVADVATLESAEHYGGVRLWGSLGFLVAAVLAGNYLKFETPTTYLVAIAMLMWGAFLISFTIPGVRQLPERPRLRDALRLLQSLPFQLFLVAALGWQLAHSGYDLCISLHLQTLGASGTVIGIAWGIATLAEVILLGNSERLLARFGAVPCLGMGLAAAAFRWALIGSLDSLSLILVLQPLHALSFGLVWVAAMHHVRHVAEPRLLASAQGMTTASMALGTTIGMLVWGTVNEAVGARPVFAAAALISALAAALVLRSRRRIAPADSAPIR